jgi:hypothetical protein
LPGSTPEILMDLASEYVKLPQVILKCISSKTHFWLKTMGYKTFDQAQWSKKQLQEQVPRQTLDTIPVRLSSCHPLYYLPQQVELSLKPETICPRLCRIQMLTNFLSTKLNLAKLYLARSLSTLLWLLFQPMRLWSYGRVRKTAIQTCSQNIPERDCKISCYSEVSSRISPKGIVAAIFCVPQVSILPHFLFPKLHSCFLIAFSYWLHFLTICHFQCLPAESSPSSAHSFNLQGSRPGL